MSDDVPLREGEEEECVETKENDADEQRNDQGISGRCECQSSSSSFPLAQGKAAISRIECKS